MEAGFENSTEQWKRFWHSRETRGIWKKESMQENEERKALKCLGSMIGKVGQGLDCGHQAASFLTQTSL